MGRMRPPAIVGILEVAGWLSDWIWCCFCGSFNQLIQFSTIQPHSPALWTVVDLDAFAVTHHKCRLRAYRTFHWSSGGYEAASNAVKRESGGASRSRTGLEGFAVLCITALLSRRCAFMRKNPASAFLLECTSCQMLAPNRFGAGDESRTRDLNLGKVALYQLSYSRDRVKPLSIDKMSGTAQMGCKFQVTILALDLTE